MANADLAAGGAVGAAFGVGFGNLHDAVKHVVGRIIMFKSELNRLKSTLDGGAATVQQIKELNQALNFPEEETKSLIEQMEKGKELVDKCSKIKLWNYCFKAYSYSSKLSKLNEDIKKFCQVNLIVQNTRNGLETLSLVSQNTEIGLETLTGVNQNTRVGLETLAEVDHNTTIGLETLAEVNNNTRIGLEALTELNQNTTIGLETLAEVNHNTTIGLEALAEVNELKRTLDLVLKHVERGVHGSSSPDQPAGPARNRPATTRTDQSDGRRRVATHRTRTLRVGRRVFSPKTRATRPDHQINNIRLHLKVFRRKTTNTGDIFVFPTKIYLKSTRSGKIRRYFVEI